MAGLMSLVPDSLYAYLHSKTVAVAFLAILAQRPERASQASDHYLSGRGRCLC